MAFCQVPRKEKPVGKSSGQRAYDRGFSAGYGKAPKKKNPQPRSTGRGMGTSDRSHSREFHAEPARTGVPRTRQEEQEVKVVFREDGKSDTYFGGQGRADGSGHGHVVTRVDGSIDHARESSQNGGRTYIDRR